MNTELTKFLDDQGVDYTIEDGRVVVGDHLDLRSVKEIPDGFNPKVGGEIILPDHLKHLINKAS